MSAKIRIGIDVGGTFTHAVALSADKYELLAQSKVPTTHTAKEGVAAGIIQSLKEIMVTANIQPEQVTRIAHSTTQATNALLEGDVCQVGILAVGGGLEGRRVRSETEIDPIELAPGKFLKIVHEYIDQPEGKELAREIIVSAIKALQGKGAEAIVAATAFSVDDPKIEKQIVDTAIELGLPATATHDVSKLYGLRARTRTAAINAAILPRMIYTAVMTEKAARLMNITAPLVVMRSDGGAMSIDEMKKRPILTLLSGPAAGVAAAIMAAKISDGIFLEVGGTSTDISCIVNGHPSVKMAQIGAHRIFLDTLDVRTVGVAGGSLPRIRNKQIEGVGPRSAHIAGFKYSAFPGQAEISADAELTLASLAEDGSCYPVFKDKHSDQAWSITTTCAANQLNLIPEGDYAQGNKAVIEHSLQKLAEAVGKGSADAIAEEIMAKGSLPIRKVIDDLVLEHKLRKEDITLIGGGGGASVWINYLSKKMGVKADLVDNASVISAIGAAMALLQETVERTLIDPKPEDFSAIRQQAEAALLNAGAVAESIEVRVEVDMEHGILRAVAVGSHHISLSEELLSEEDLKTRAAALLKTPANEVTLVARTQNFVVFQCKRTLKKFLGLVKEEHSPWTILDIRGRNRVSASNGEIITTTADKLLVALNALVDKHSKFGDAGKILPSAFIVTRNKVVDLSGLISSEQMSAICEEELKRLGAEETVVVAVKIG
ncbi:MAG: hydantoinase/oxoprolinase family protein [Candidatus Margulisiibacteriota bacterium]|jgi:N-methylhydantoinase A/oxoprolinase/acetone carboxylase beta subunit